MNERRPYASSRLCTTDRDSPPMTAQTHGSAHMSHDPSAHTTLWFFLDGGLERLHVVGAKLIATTYRQVHDDSPHATEQEPHAVAGHGHEPHAYVARTTWPCSAPNVTIELALADA